MFTIIKWIIQGHLVCHNSKSRHSIQRIQDLMLYMEQEDLIMPSCYTSNWKSYQGKHIFVVDSRQRDCKLYPTPSNYRIPVDQIYKNITSIELKGAVLPKTAYGVHDSNNVIDFLEKFNSYSCKTRRGTHNYPL